MSVTLRRVATAIGNMKDNNPLANFFNRIKARAGTPKAITATANKLARIIWTLFNKKENFDPTKLMPDPMIIKKKQIKNVTKKLLNLNLNKDELSVLLNNVTGSLSVT
jgi:transposase